ncbi:MAG: hypothetical protein HYZ53_12665 [Planctomycetes bacterium]|nr:hypothetical protein [Planctomycetota bacterium]
MSLNPRRLAVAGAVLLVLLLLFFFVETDSGRVRKVVERGRAAVVRGDADACAALFVPDYDYRGQNRAGLEDWLRRSLGEFKFSDARILGKEIVFPTKDEAQVKLDALLRPGADASFPEPFRVQLRLHLKLARRQGQPDAWLIDRLEPIDGAR